MCTGHGLERSRLQIPLRVTLHRIQHESGVLWHPVEEKDSIGLAIFQDLCVIVYIKAS